MSRDAHRGRFVVPALLVLVPLLMATLGGEALRAALRYERPLLAHEPWRLASAHLVHLSTWHALLNAAGAILLWALFAACWGPIEWFAIVGCSTAAVDFGLWTFSPAVHWYVGASGVLHGVFAAGLVALLRAGRPDAETLALCALLVAKLAWEQLHGALPLAGAGLPVVVAAHLYGAVGGVGCALLLLAGRRVAGKRMSIIRAPGAVAGRGDRSP